VDVPIDDGPWTADDFMVYRPFVTFSSYKWLKLPRLRATNKMQGIAVIHRRCWVAAFHLTVPGEQYLLNPF
jgi:hypothetical protein